MSVLHRCRNAPTDPGRHRAVGAAILTMAVGAGRITRLRRLSRRRR